MPSLVFHRIRHLHTRPRKPNTNITRNIRNHIYNSYYSCPLPYSGVLVFSIMDVHTKRTASITGDLQHDDTRQPRGKPHEKKKVFVPHCRRCALHTSFAPPNPTQPNPLLLYPPPSVYTSWYLYRRNDCCSSVPGAIRARQERAASCKPICVLQP